MRGWFEVRWWLGWNSECKFGVHPNMVISDIGAKTCFQMSNGTWNSHVVISVTQFDRDSLQGWIMLRQSTSALAGDPDPYPQVYSNEISIPGSVQVSATR